MDSIRKYDISLFGEFVDKDLEREFLEYDMRRFAKFIGPVTFIFGIMYMLFIITDYFAIGNTASFKFVVVLRALIFLISTGLFIYRKEISNSSNIIYLITIFEAVAILSFLGIIYLYPYFTYLTYFSVIVITLSIYVMPNRLINAQILSLVFVISFFLVPAKNMKDFKTSDIWKMAVYVLIAIVLCNISTYLTNLYKRKQFADSKELIRVSITDSLTGIYNRNKFIKELDIWIDYSNRSGSYLSLVIFDIDDFKKVNDGYGHFFGDSVIQSITSTIRKVIRSTDIFARWGGEEFVILLPNTDIRRAMEITERLRKCVQEISHDIIGKVTCSFGLVTLRKNENGESFMRRADELLYHAKDLGKNTIVNETSRNGKQAGSTTLSNLLS